MDQYIPGVVSFNILVARLSLTITIDYPFSIVQPPRVINYLDVATPNLEGYYGGNLDRLKRVKSLYDPRDYFKNPMTIPVGTLLQPPEVTTGDGDASSTNNTDTGGNAQPATEQPTQSTSASDLVSSLYPFLAYMFLLTLTQL